MLDPFSALSVAAAVVQFVDYGTGLISKAVEIYRSPTGEPEDIKALRDMVVRLKTLTREIPVLARASSTTLSGQDPQPKTAKDQLATFSSNEKSIIDLGTACQDLAEKICADLMGIETSNKPSRIESLKLAYKLRSRKKQLDTHRLQLDSMRSELNTHLLATLHDDRSRTKRMFNDLRRSDKQLELNMTTNLDSLENLMKQGLETNKQSNDIVAGLPRLISTLLGERHDISATHYILRSLRHDYMQTRLSQIADRYATTYEWIFDCPTPSTAKKAEGRSLVKFQPWLALSAGIFWISGKAGSGKSTLMKFLYKSPRTEASLASWSKGAKLVTAHHFFWNAGSYMQRSQQGLLQSLCYEILRQCPRLIPEVCHERWHQARRIWSFEELMELVTRLSARQLDADGQPLKYCFFVDGLDEYDGNHDDTIKILKQMARSDNIKLCLSSRPWNVFENAFGRDRTRTLLLQDLTHQDIATYVEGQLGRNESYLEMVRQSASCQMIVMDVTERAQGVFLWVFLAIRELQRSLVNGDSFHDLQRRLRRMPPDLDPYFDRMLNNIDPFYQEQSARTFLLCQKATSPLPLLGLAALEKHDLAEHFASHWKVAPDEITSIEDAMRKRINARCQDLLEIYFVGGQRTVVDFLRRTVRDFLKTREMHDKLTSRAGTEFDALESLCTVILVPVSRAFADGLWPPRDNYAAEDLQDFASYVKQATDERGDIPVIMLDRLSHLVNRSALSRVQEVLEVADNLSFVDPTLCDHAFRKSVLLMQFCTAHGLSAYAKNCFVQGLNITQSEIILLHGFEQLRRKAAGVLQPDLAFLCDCARVCGPSERLREHLLDFLSAGPLATSSSEQDTWLFIAECIVADAPASFWSDAKTQNILSASFNPADVEKIRQSRKAKTNAHKSTGSHTVSNAGNQSSSWAWSSLWNFGTIRYALDK